MDETSKFNYRVDPVLGRALAYWRDKRGSRSMPCRRDVDPVEVPTLLPNFQLIEIVSGDRFRYRLVGTALVEVFGRDYTGSYLDELFEGPRAKSMAKVFSAVRDAKRPMFLRMRYVTAESAELIANRLYLPLSNDDREVNMILGVLTFDIGVCATIAGAWGSAQLASAETRIEIVDIDQ